MAATLREKQTAALKRMLNFNELPTKQSSSEPRWKILVYDRIGQDIISPLLTVKDLRDIGVTLHLNLHSDRDPIPDVPAIYFIMPTEENIQRICRDLNNQLYESYYFNFISPVSRQKLEDVASAAIQSNNVSQVSKIFDQYLNFISLENDLFTLRHQDKDTMSYYSINRGDVKDTEIEHTMDTIVDSLFSVFVTIGVVPIIRCPRGNAAEMIAEKLDKRLRENIRDTRNSLFAAENMPGQFSFQRPLLVLLDRSIDLATMLHHTWTYQALAHDVLDLKLNRVEIEEISEVRTQAGSPRPIKKKKSYDLSINDKFWQTHKGSPFPTVAEAVQEELDVYRTQEDEVKKLKAAMGLEGEDDSAISMLSDNTARLTSAVSSLPELLEKKRLIDMHTNIATALLDQIKSRKLDIYFESEEKMMSKALLDKSLMDLISDPEAGTPEDKVRLFIIALLCGPHMSEAEIDQYCVALQGANCDIASVQYIRRWKAYAKMTAAPSQYGGGGGVSTVNMFSNLVSKGSQFVMEGVKNLSVKQHNLPTTRVVDALMEMKSYQDVDDYKYFDPKLLRADSSSVPRNKSPYQDAFVFVVGGGNYIEYQNLIDYSKQRSSMPKRIVYGCSNLVNTSQFLKQLSHLGNEI